MLITDKLATSISLDNFLGQPETKPAIEYIAGDIHQKVMPQGEHSRIQTRLSASINNATEPNKLALAFTELRCTFDNYSIVTDISVFAWSNIPRTAEGKIENLFHLPPDWIIEILSPEQRLGLVVKKITHCLNHGTQLGWLISPDDQSVLIFRPQQTLEAKTDDELLPMFFIDWQLTVQELFSWLSV